MAIGDPQMMMALMNPQLRAALGLGAPGGGPPPNPPAISSLIGAPGGVTPPATGGPRSNPGLMPNSSPQTAPQAGTYESGPKMAGDSQNTPTNREPTGENPQRPQAQNSFPPIPRNRFGALLMPQGGQVGGMSGAAPNPGQAFNWQNILNSFLQKRGLGGQPGGQPGVGGAPGVMGMGTGTSPM